MYQQTFGDIEYSNRRRITRREKFLAIMDAIIPWAEWIAMIQPYYYANTRGRKPKDIEVMLRMYLMQDWFNLSDEDIEEAIYDSYAMRRFLGINFSEEQVPDATTLLNFRHLLEQHRLGKKIFDDVKSRLDSQGLMMHGGTIVDATIIEAPSSTKNREGKRDPEMHQTKKGGKWHFGMKIHAGVDAGSGYVHTVTGTAANVHDIEETHKLMREDDQVGYGDSGYIGVEKREEFRSDEHLREIDFRTNVRPSSIQLTPAYEGVNWDKEIEKSKSSVRCKVEHIFLIVKKQFGYAKVVYRGLEKNLNRFHVLFACANLLLCARAGRTADFVRA